jgi:hypothetical protein
MNRLRIQQLVLLGACLALGATSVVDAQSRQSVAPPVPTDLTSSLANAMRSRIAVAYDSKNGGTIPAAHCRHAPGGCDARISTFAQYLVEAGHKYAVDPWLLAAMAFKESGFNPFALGSIGERGILQINPGRKDAKQVRFIQDEFYRRRCTREPGACQREIVDHAASVLARSLERCGGDVGAALGAYNTGRCNGHLGYSKRILEAREELLQAAGLKPADIAEEKPARKSRHS